MWRPEGTNLRALPFGTIKSLSSSTNLAVLHVESISDAVDLLVDLRAVMITLLSDAGDRIGDPGRMPGSDASHFAKTLVCLARQLLHVPTGDDTCTAEKKSVNRLNIGDWESNTRAAVGFR